ncbi:DUF1446-domain-containing protein [Meredithblackwellia eburnea MCA 4105]
MVAEKRPIRIAGCSGSVTDRRAALARLAQSPSAVDVIIGDWMSEYNMTTQGGKKSSGEADAFEPTFLEALEPALESLAKNRIKFIANGGASDTKRLAETVLALVTKRSLPLTIAWVEGDEAFPQVQKIIADGTLSTNITTGANVKDWGFDPIYAQAYLGAYGIVTALDAGADIVICGRVADASPVVAAAQWWHQWSREAHGPLASAFVAGHIAECSTYVTGGNFSGFKQLGGAWTELGYPIVEIENSGDFIVTKEEGSQGLVSKATVTAQLVYEIQGPYYYHSDVTADLRNIKVEDIAPNRVRVSQVIGLPPPPTTKVGITARGGYQAEAHYYIVGLDVKEKAQMIKDQILAHIDQSAFSLLKFMVTGTAAEDPRSQDEATVEFRIFAQSRSADALSAENFFRVVSDQIMQSYPGSTFGVDTRQAFPKPFYEYFVALMPQNLLNHKAHILGSSPHELPIAVPTTTRVYDRLQPSGDSGHAFDAAEWGPTRRMALGRVVHARSGDKGSDANVGFFVRHDDEWPWLRDLLTSDKVIELLGPDYKKGERVERFEMPNINAVHFLLKNHLDRGVASTSTYDFLGKNVAEYLRAKYVDIPVKFLERGLI